MRLEAGFEGVLEHIDRDAVAAFQAEVRRVLKPGGTLLERITAPAARRMPPPYSKLSLTESEIAENQLRNPFASPGVTIQKVLPGATSV